MPIARVTIPHNFDEGELSACIQILTPLSGRKLRELPGGTELMDHAVL